LTEGQTTRGTAAALRVIALYQAARAGRPSSCRFHPSCSVYAAEAVTRHGALRGTGLAARRLLRCRPFGPHGIDEVPSGAHGAAR
jgi:putative membrane protein insertion efficiency factor